MKHRGGMTMKYRVTISQQIYYTDDIEANSPEEAEKIANERLREDEKGYLDSLEAYDDYGAYVVEGEAFEIEEEDN